MSKRNKGRAAALYREPGGAPNISDRKLSAKEIEPQSAKQVYYDNANEQLVNAGREDQSEEFDDDDDEHDERHQLIGKAGRPAGGRLVRESAARLDGGQDQNERQQVMFAQNGGKTNSRLARLAGIFSSAGVSWTSQSPAASGLHEHKADFVYQSNGLDEPGRVQSSFWSAARLVGPYQSGNTVRMPAANYRSAGPPNGRSNQGSHWPTKTTASRRRWTISAVLVLALLVGLCLFKLLALIREERHRLISPNPPLSRQDLVEQLTKQLDQSHRSELEVDKLQRWLVSTPKCHIPMLEPWDSSIASYVHVKPPMNCSQILEDILARREDSSGALANPWPPLLSRSLSFIDSNRLFFTQEALSLGALSGSSGQPGHCCLKRVSRKEANDDELDVAEACEPIAVQGAYVNSSVIEVVCAAWNYTNVHSLVVHNQEEEAALARVASQKLNPDGDFYSVLMVGVDTISRLNGHRQLNRTLETLSRLYNTLDFFGYNKVGENTFPNLIPLLTGLRPEQLAEIQCWLSEHYSAENESGDDYLDNCKFLWNFYQQAGYLTYIGEDWPQASTFNYLKPGFKFQPSNFYGRPFTLARDKLVYPKFKSPGCASCQLDRPLVEVDINNLKGFIENNTNRLPYFALHWINCPQHDDLNGASQIDHILEKFFASMRDKLEADRTFVLFFSDHGFRWNDFVSTRVGHYESSLPLLTIASPKAFIERHPDLYARMKSHQNALLTPFDMFKTLVDLKDLGSRKARDKPVDVKPAAKVEPLASGARQQFVAGTITPAHGRDVVTIMESSEGPAATSTATATVKQLKLVDGTSYEQKFQSLSLFESHTADQLDRGCIEAGIPDNYCVCHQFQPVAAERTDTLGAAYYLVYVHLEARLRNHLNICRRLDLERVHHAELFDLEKSSSTKNKTSSSRRRKRSRVVDEKNLEGQKRVLTSARPAKHLHDAEDSQNKHDYLPNREYSIMFSTKPGGGLFQEVVRFYGSNMTACELEVGKARKVVEDEWAKAEDKHESVLTMNDVCDFSVHSESLSRFNLYKDQSKCVKSNIELKKICYCNDLTS